MSSSDSTLGASSKRPVLYWWLTLLVVLMVSAIASPRTKSSGDTHELACGSTVVGRAVLDGCRFRMPPH